MYKLILLVPAVALLALGSEGLFYAARGRQEAIVTCEEFARTRPSSVRVRVTGCEPDYAHAAYRESGSTLEELFLPVRPVGQPTRPASLVVATSDPAALAIAQRVLGTNGSSEQSLAAMKRVADYLGLSIAADGIVRAGLLERLRSRRILSGLSDAVAADAVVVDLRAAPNLLRPMLALAAGLAIAIVVWLLMRRSTTAHPSRATDAPIPTPVFDANVNTTSEGVRPGSDPLAPATPAVQGGVPELVETNPIKPGLKLTSDPEGVRPRSDPSPGPEAEPRRAKDEPRVTVMLPKLLLLDVDVLAGPEAVEAAPPLGTRADVSAILSGVIPSLDFVNGTRLLARADGSITLDIGTHDPVATVVAEVHGQAGVALIKELLLMTGWRAFAPKTGLFVSTDDLESLAALATELQDSSQLPASSSQPGPASQQLGPVSTPDAGSRKLEAGS